MMRFLTDTVAQTNQLSNGKFPGGVSLGLLKEGVGKGNFSIHCLWIPTGTSHTPQPASPANTTVSGRP
jgi:hypothetical protein